MSTDRPVRLKAHWRDSRTISVQPSLSQIRRIHAGSILPSASIIIQDYNEESNRELKEGNMYLFNIFP
jgi:hypothetical protein